MSTVNLLAGVSLGRAPRVSCAASYRRLRSRLKPRCQVDACIVCRCSGPKAAIAAQTDQRCSSDSSCIDRCMSAPSKAKELRAVNAPIRAPGKRGWSAEVISTSFVSITFSDRVPSASGLTKRSCASARRRRQTIVHWTPHLAHTGESHGLPAASQEDDLLQKLIRQHGTKAWVVCARHLGKWSSKQVCIACLACGCAPAGFNLHTALRS